MWLSDMTAIFQTGDSQRESNLVNQRQMPMLGEARKPQLAPWDLVAKCRHRLDAIRLCVQLSHLANDTLCARLGLDKGHFTRMMQGRAHFPDAKSVDLMNVCGNYAPLQYEAMACGFQLFEDVKKKREQELLEELETLRRTA